MIQYIGLDAHSSSCTFSVMNKDGKEIDNTTIETNGRLLVNYLRSIPGKKELTFEECELSSWLFEILKKEVNKVVICNPVANRDFKGKKTDKFDARKLAQLLRGKFLSSVYHDGSDREKFRALISGYQDVVNEGVRLKNRYKSLFRKRGKKAKGQKLYNDQSLLEDLERTDLKFIGRQTYQMLESLEEIRQRYLKEIRKCSRRFKEIGYLKRLPGIGTIQAAKITAQVINPKRFANKYKYWSYCGLVRHKRTSGDRNYGSKKIWGNCILKCVYKMAGHAAIKGNNGLRRYYDHLRLKGTSDKNAYNAVCRKIAAISLAVWKNETVYNDQLLKFDKKDETLKILLTKK